MDRIAAHWLHRAQVASRLTQRAVYLVTHDDKRWTILLTLPRDGARRHVRLLAIIAGECVIRIPRSNTL